MKKIFLLLFVACFSQACKKEDVPDNSLLHNPVVELQIPEGFPAMNSAIKDNPPTKYGVILGEKLFNEKRFSANNTISCGSCHQQAMAFADNNQQAVGIFGRISLRNVSPIQNLAFMRFYNWDGNQLRLEKQPLVPIITHEEMNSSILEVIGKIAHDKAYKELFKKTFGSEELTPEKIFKSLAQYEYTLISANSKYDKVKRGEGETFTAKEARGYQLFQQKCVSCHSTELFTDQSFRNIGFPINPNGDEAGRARVTGLQADYMSFRVPSLRNAEYTAPYGSFGQFSTLKAVLDYFDNGVLNADNLDPILKDNGNRIAMTEQEKWDLISFIKTLSDKEYVGQ